MTSSDPIPPAEEVIKGTSLVQNSAFLRKPKLIIRTDAEIWVLSAICGVLVFLGALAIQWIIYDEILRQDGLRLVGSIISGVFAVVLVQGMSFRTRQSRLSELRRLEKIALMNHHIRNALQAIVCCSGSSESSNIIHDSINRIERVLSDVLPGTEDIHKGYVGIRRRVESAQPEKPQKETITPPF